MADESPLVLFFSFHYRLNVANCNRGCHGFLKHFWHYYGSLQTVVVAYYKPERDIRFTMLCSGLSIANPSVVCNVRALYSRGWNFRQYFFATLYLSHPLTSVQNFTEIIVGIVKRKSGSKIGRCHVRVSHLRVSSCLWTNLWLITTSDISRCKLDEKQRTSVPDRLPDGQTDEHHGNSATIRSNEHIAR